MACLGGLPGGDKLSSLTIASYGQQIRTFYSGMEIESRIQDAKSFMLT